MKYVGTFGSGWQTIIKKELEKERAKIIEIYDGFVIFEITKINKYPYFNNLYLLLDKKKTVSHNIDVNINEVLKNINIDYEKVDLSLENIKHRTFKIKGFQENNPVKMDYRNLTKLEKDIAKNTNMKVENNADVEFDFLERSEGYIFFLLKLTYNRMTEKNLKPGMLRPEVAHLLACMADVKPTDILLDPFCGYGGIIKAILKDFKYNMFFASDIDEEKVSSLKKEYKNNKKNLFIKVADALTLEKFDDNFLDVIITDPPWNEYEKTNDNYIDFYSKMLKSFHRIIKEEGKVVILMGNIKDFENALQNTKLFKEQEKLSVLINGKKANVYLLKKY